MIFRLFIYCEPEDHVRIINLKVITGEHFISVLEHSIHGIHSYPNHFFYVEKNNNLELIDPKELTNERKKILCILTTNTHKPKIIRNFEIAHHFSTRTSTRILQFFFPERENSIDLPLIDMYFSLQYFTIGTEILGIGKCNIDMQQVGYAFCHTEDDIYKLSFDKDNFKCEKIELYIDNPILYNTEEGYLSFRDSSEEILWIRDISISDERVILVYHGNQLNTNSTILKRLNQNGTTIWADTGNRILPKNISSTRPERFHPIRLRTAAVWEDAEEQYFESLDNACSASISSWNDLYILKKELHKSTSIIKNTDSNDQAELDQTAKMHITLSVPRVHLAVTDDNEILIVTEQGYQHSISEQLRSEEQNSFISNGIVRDMILLHEIDTSDQSGALVCIAQGSSLGFIRIQYQ